MLLVIDNFDSFTYNLVQYFGQLGVEQQVFRNNAITVEEALALNPDRIMISPGPCSPNEAGVSLAMIEAFAGKKPLLGVCLGHQSIGQHFGGMSSAPSDSCTGRPALCLTMIPISFQDYPIRWRPPATIR